MLYGQRDDEIPVIGYEGVGDAEDPAASLACPRSERALDIGGATTRR